MACLELPAFKAEFADSFGHGDLCELLLLTKHPDIVRGNVTRKAKSSGKADPSHRSQI
jgi:hypothetical protein